MTTQLVITDFLVLKLLNLEHDKAQNTNLSNFLNFLDFAENHAPPLYKMSF